MQEYQSFWPTFGFMWTSLLMYHCCKLGCLFPVAFIDTKAKTKAKTKELTFKNLKFKANGCQESLKISS